MVTRKRKAHGTDDDRIQRLALEALKCRVESHDWPRGQGIEYVHVETYADGSVKIGECRKRCGICGLPRYEIYSFSYPGAPAEFVSGPHYRYSEVENYRLKSDPERPGRPRPTKADYRAELWARTAPWATAGRPAGRRRAA